MSVLQDMKSMRARVALAFALSTGLICVGVGMQEFAAGSDADRGGGGSDD